MTVNEIKEKLQNTSIVDKYIYANVVVFVVALTINALKFLQSGNSNFIVSYFALSVDSSEYLYKPYTFITYGFVHFGFIHLIFNLIALHYLGNLFIDFFSERKFIIYYLLGSVFGGVFFVLSYNFFPVFKDTNGVLVGASAAISAILVGLATYMPNYEINLRLIGYVKLWIITAIFIFLSVVLIPNGNAGGQLAHLGGAFIGFVLTRYFYREQKQERKSKTRSNLKTVYTSKEKSEDFGLSNHQKKIVQQRKIDTLLDKISKSGYESLTEKERSFLASASKK